MTQKKQEDAFERELHSLCTRFFDEWDIDPWSMIELLECEKLFVLSLMASKEDDDEEWGSNGSNNE